MDKPLSKYGDFSPRYRDYLFSLQYFWILIPLSIASYWVYEVLLSDLRVLYYVPICTYPRTRVLSLLRSMVM